MSAYARYILLRFSLFAAVVLVGYLLGMRELLLVVFAVVVSALLSYLLLGGPRRAVVERLQERAERRHAARMSRADTDTAAEDAADDARRG